jgi:hypothetical protein
VLAYLRLTLRQGLRLPAVWVLSALGVLSVLAGLGLSVLALGGPAAGEAALLTETTQTTSALVILWLLASLHDADWRSGFVQAADQTQGGTRARQLGRLLGAGLVATLAALPTALVGALAADAGPSPMYLLLTTIAPGLLVGAWALLLLAASASSALAVFGGLALWLAGHLPWGDGGAAEGWPTFGAAWLPGRAAALHPDPTALLAALGLVLLALACGRPVRSSS